MLSKAVRARFINSNLNSVKENSSVPYDENDYDNGDEGDGNDDNRFWMRRIDRTFEKYVKLYQRFRDSSLNRQVWRVGWIQ